jgi:hypothetical protein
MTAEIRAIQALEALRTAGQLLEKSCASISLLDQFAALLAEAEIELDLSEE